MTMRHIRRRIRNIYWGAPMQARIFLVLAPLFGLTYLALSAPMQPADEPQHYWRIYQLSELQLFPEPFDNGRYGDVVPATVAGFAQDSFSGKNPIARFNKANVSHYAHTTASGAPTPVYFENTAIYPPTSYLPQIIGIGLGRLLDLPLAYGFYAGRVLNLLTWIALVFCALYIMPFGRWAMLALALMPMTVYQAASLSADAMLIGLAFLGIAYFFYLYRLSSIRPRHIALAALLLAALAAGKQTYGLLLLPYLFLPWRSFAGKRQYYCLMGGLVASVAAITLGWSLAVSDIANHIHAVLQPGVNIIPGEQVIHMLTNPLGFLGAVAFTVFIDNFNLLLFGIIGFFGWLDIGLSSFAYYSAVVLLVLAVLKDGADLPAWRLPVALRRWLHASAFLMALAICAFLYIGYTAVSSGEVAGLQGRYFIPVLALSLPLLASRKMTIKMADRRFVRLFCGLAILVLLAGVFALLDANFLRLLSSEA